MTPARAACRRLEEASTREQDACVVPCRTRRRGKRVKKNKRGERGLRERVGKRGMDGGRVRVRA